MESLFSSYQKSKKRYKYDLVLFSWMQMQKPRFKKEAPGLVCLNKPWELFLSASQNAAQVS